MVQLVSLWPPRLGMGPTPLPLLIVAIRVALVTVTFVESTLLVEDAATCGHERRGENVYRAIVRDRRRLPYEPNKYTTYLPSTSSSPPYGQPYYHPRATLKNDFRPFEET